MSDLVHISRTSVDKQIRTNYGPFASEKEALDELDLRYACPE